MTKLITTSGCAKAASMSPKLFTLIEETAMAMTNKPSYSALVNADYSAAAISLRDSAQKQLAPLAIKSPYIEPVKPTIKPKVSLIPLAAPTVDGDAAPVIPTVPTTVEEAFPTLVGIGNALKYVKNLFVKAFKLPKKPTSRLFVHSSPLTALKEAFKSSDSLKAFTGQEKVKGDLPNDLLFQYRKLLTVGDKLIASMNKQLKAGLTPYAIKLLNDADPGINQTTKKKINAVLRQRKFKALNITEPDGKGGYQYNQKLLESAAVAALHWFQTSPASTSVKDEDDIAAIASISVEDVTPELMNAFNGSNLLLVDILPKLAETVRRFWGVQSNHDFDQSMVEGIPLAIATELLITMIGNGMITKVEIPVGKKTINVYSLNRRSYEDNEAVGIPEASINVVRAYPSLLGEVVETEPEESMWFGDDLPPIAKTQINNRLVQNTDAQRAALEREQKTPFYLNQPMFNLVSQLGKDFLLDAFGGGSKLDPNTNNVNHLQSQEGRNTNVASAFGQMNETIAQLQNRVNATPGLSLTDMAIHYAYNMSRTGRMHMLGRFNPQASKLMREVFMPNGVTIDLTKAENKALYKLALAQMLGIKIHTMTAEESFEKLLALLNGDLKKAIEALAKFNKTGTLPAGSMPVIQAAIAKADGTVMALHAMLDYARFTATTDFSKYKTSVYVEADGVTNGPANAILMLSQGQFTEADLVRMGMGGFFLEPDKTMNTHRKNTIDMYQTAAGNLSEQLGILVGEMFQSDILSGSEKRMKPTLLFNDLKSLLAMFINDITISPDGKSIEIQRGATKNPLTVTIYGAGKAGLVNKVVAALTESMYEKFSDALKFHKSNPSMSVAEALFGSASVDKQAAEKQFTELNRILKNLTQLNIRYEALSDSDETMVYRVKANMVDGKNNFTALPITFDSLKTFTLFGGNLKAIVNNISVMYVSPLQKAIEATVGDSVLSSANLIQVATQVQSIAMAAEFKATVERLVNSVQANGAPTEFLSRNQQDKVILELEKKYPFLRNGEQRFFVGSSVSTDIKAEDFAAALTGDFRSSAVISGPSDAGVAGIPYVVIGMGDGMTMQDASNDPNGPKRTLKIFDGVNLPLDQINDGSRSLNEAVSRAWQRNPLRMIVQSFEQAIKGVEELFPSDVIMQDDAELDENEIAIARAYKSAGVESAQEFLDKLRQAADSIDARHTVLQRVKYSVDQMASAAQPFQNQGENLEDLSSLSPDQRVARLNELYLEELAKLQMTKAEQAAKAAVERQKFINLSEKRAKFVNDIKQFLLNRDTLIELVRTGSDYLTDDQKTILKQLMNSGEAMSYNIYFGSRDALNSVFGLTGDDALQQGDLGGTDIDNKYIFIVSDNITNPLDASETILHELIHAATARAVNEYFLNQTSGDKAVDKAIENIIDLTDQLLNDKLIKRSKWPLAARTAHDNLKRTIDSIQSNPNLTREQKAGKKYSEVMAWVLANKDLANATSKVKVSIVQQMFDALVSLVQAVFGIKKLQDGYKFFDALMFNTLIVTQGQSSISNFTAGMTLKHSVAYGNDEKLIQIEKNMQNKIVAFATGSPVQAAINATVGMRAKLFSRNLADGVRTIFPMTEQEFNTFQAITTVMATEIELNPGAMVKAQEMYTHTLKNIDVSSFMVDSVANDPNDAQQASEKFDLLVGKSIILKDLNNRSSLLPVFLALAATNGDLRAVLNKVEMPKGTKHPGKTFDDYLRNYSNASIDWISNVASGTSKSKTVQDAMDALNIKLYELAEQKESMLEKMSTGSGSFLGSANDRLVKMMTKLADQAYTKADVIGSKSKNKFVKTAANMTKVLSGIASESSAAAVSEGVIELLNKVNGKQAIVDLFNDLVGRTESNANVFDMIKIVRTAIQQLRQNFRENVPDVIASKFNTEPTDEQWTSLHTVMGKSDMASLAEGRTFAQVVELLTDHSSLVREINAFENRIRKADPVSYDKYVEKSKQLANYMIKGIPGKNLLRNANAISAMLNEGPVTTKDDAFKSDIDQLVTLYALDNLPKNDVEVFSSLVQNGEAKGLEFAYSYLKGQRKDEVAKATGKAYYNALKGYIPAVPASNMTLIVANDSDHAMLVSKSYTRVGTYTGDGSERMNKSYYFLPSNSRPSFAQGIMQNVVHTAGGIDARTGISTGPLAGVITDPTYLAKILARTKRNNTVSTEGYVPVFNDLGEVIALERTLDPAQLERLKYNTKLHKMIGVWRGRQTEEATADAYNTALVGNLHEMYKRDMRAGRTDGYINIFESDDPVVIDAVKLLNKHVIEEMEMLVGEKGEFFVRKTMLNDAFGYRNASVGDMWTGNSRWSPSTQEFVKRTATLFMGNKAYAKLVNSEKFLSNAVASAKSTIVVKSVIVPAANIVANLYQLVSHGVNPAFMYKKAPQKLQEIESYVKSNIRLVEAEAELLAFADDNLKSIKLKAEIQLIKDGHERLTIWPLIKAGEFSSISDVGLNHEDVDIAQGKWMEHIDRLVDRLPPSVRNAGRYAWISQDTALFQGLQKMVQYGDFVAKAILYDDLVTNKGLNQKAALAVITEEFVHYDRLPGRFRGYMEQIGMSWFYNFKIRTLKIALSTIRNNPLQALLVHAAPLPEFFTGPIGSPITDNILTKGIEGSLDNSIGLGQGFAAPGLHPFISLIN